MCGNRRAERLPPRSPSAERRGCPPGRGDAGAGQTGCLRLPEVRHPEGGRVLHLSGFSGVPEGQRGAFYLVRVDVEGGEVGRGNLRGQVKLGMAGQVEIVTEQESILSLLLRKI